MPLPSPETFNNDDFDLEETNLPIRQIKNYSTEKKKQKNIKHRLSSKKIDAAAKIQAEIDDQGDERKKKYTFTYLASRFESGWLSDSLGYFFDNHWIDDVIRMIKGGKEASVYLCKANPSSRVDWIAAKVYRPRQFRNLKNDSLYREGRQYLDENGQAIHNHGVIHAINKRTSVGEELIHGSWIQHEYQTMQVLHAAGGDVPVPYVCGHNAILMEYIGDEDVAAPTLNTVDLTVREARSLLNRVLHNVELALSNQRVHADLSAFNILYWQGDITLIDFPQAIDPVRNVNAFRIFERDLIRICSYFTHQGAPANGKKIAEKMWDRFNYPYNPPIVEDLLD